MKMRMALLSTSMADLSPMYYIIYEEQLALETMSSYAQYLTNLPHERENETDAIQTDTKNKIGVVMTEILSKHSYTLYAEQGKVRFFKLLFEKCLNPSAAARRLGFHIRAAQRWAGNYEKNSDSIFEKFKKTGGHLHIVNEKYKEVILKCTDESPSSALEQVVKRLREAFKDLKISKNVLYKVMRNDYNITLKKT
jgi:transposase